MIARSALAPMPPFLRHARGAQGCDQVPCGQKPWSPTKAREFIRVSKEHPDRGFPSAGLPVVFRPEQHGAWNDELPVAEESILTTAQTTQCAREVTRLERPRTTDASV